MSFHIFWFITSSFPEKATGFAEFGGVSKQSNLESNKTYQKNVLVPVGGYVLDDTYLAVVLGGQEFVAA